MEPITAFTTDQVHHLTGLSVRQLRYWDSTDFFSPSVSDEMRRPFGRVYSFSDLVALRTIALLMKQHGIRLPQLRRVGEWLSQRPYESWESLKFYVAGRQVFFRDSDLQLWRAAARPEQTAIAILLEEVIRHTADDARTLTIRTPDEIGRVAQHRYVAHNAPTIAGTRIRTETIWEFAEAGYPPEEILRQFPRLTAPDVDAALRYERAHREKLAG